MLTCLLNFAARRLADDLGTLRVRRVSSPALALVIAAIFVVFLAGCGGNGLSAVEVEGRVTVGGQPVELGEIRFVPLDGTPGSVNVARIEQGKYRISARGGVPLGKHRVEIDAQQRTGRQVMDYNGTEYGPVDETLPVAPEIYRTADSPLTVEIGPQDDGHLDFDLPALPSTPGTP